MLHITLCMLHVTLFMSLVAKNVVCFSEFGIQSLAQTQFLWKDPRQEF